MLPNNFSILLPMNKPTKVNKALIVVGEEGENVVRSARNLVDIQTASPSTINVYDILKYDTVIITKSSVEAIEEVYA